MKTMPGFTWGDLVSRNASVLLMMVGLGLSIAGPAVVGAAQEPQQPTPLAPDATAYGMTLPEWAVAHTQWSASLPKSVHPLADATGEFWAVGQRMPVWFLEFSGEASVTRGGTIPAGTSLLCAVGRFTMSGPPDQSNPGYLRSRAKELGDKLKVAASIDGVPVADLKPYRITTPLFSIIVPSDNLFDIPAASGSSMVVRSVASGYWIFLPPLSPGRHVIHLQASLDDSHGEVTYNLTVRAP